MGRAQLLSWALRTKQLLVQCFAGGARVSAFQTSSQVQGCWPEDQALSGLPEISTQVSRKDLAGVSILAASVGHTGRRVLLGHTFNTL